MIKQPVILFEHVSKSFILNRENSLKHRLSHLWNNRNERMSIIKDISFSVSKGEAIGLFGPNGSGKSTILRLVAGIIKPDTGHIKVRGKVAPVLELGSGLHPELSGLDNIFLYGAILGMSKQYIYTNLEKIVAFSELSTFINVPIKKYSSGMKARLAFSVALFSDADILLIDEIFAVGDISFRDKSLRLLSQIKKYRTILFTSHDLSLMQQVCDYALIIDDGSILNEQNENLIIFLQQMPQNQQFIAEATSNSMYPLIKKGDNVTIRKSEFESIKAGDIISFYLSRMPEIIVHRVVDTIIKHGEKICITKGDSAFGLDAWEIQGSNYLGKVIKIRDRCV